MTKLRVLDLFSGIGGFSLGLERTGGFETVAFCEIEAFPRKVLAKHWPDVPCYDDVRTLASASCGRIDVITAGFPCQDISLSGRGEGIAGARSGLWAEVARLVGELRPLFVILENSPALLVRGFDVVLSDLAALGYDAQWHCIPAAYAGAPHLRDRIWIVAYPMQDGELTATIGNLDWQILYQAEWPEIADATGGHVAWAPEPCVARVANGLPNVVDRRSALGNAVVPQIPELIGRAILAALQDNRTARLSRACAAGEAFDPRVSPNPLQNVSHDAPYTGERA
jgi:DNA (cytosine-5)-methyltransferase 1